MYAKTIHLLCVPNKVFVKCQAQGFSFNYNSPPCIRPCENLPLTAILAAHRLPMPSLTASKQK